MALIPASRPLQGLIDEVTLIQEINEIVQPITSKELANTYQIVPVDLGVARSNVALGINGVGLAFLRKEGNFSMRFNKSDADEINQDDVVTGSMIRMEFSEIYVTNATQTGKALVLWIDKRT